VSFAQRSERPSEVKIGTFSIIFSPGLHLFRFFAGYKLRGQSFGTLVLVRGHPPTIFARFGALSGRSPHGAHPLTVHLELISPLFGPPLAFQVPLASFVSREAEGSQPFSPLPLFLSVPAVRAAPPSIRPPKCFSSFSHASFLCFGFSVARLNYVPVLALFSMAGFEHGSGCSKYARRMVERSRVLRCRSLLTFRCDAALHHPCG